MSEAFLQFKLNKQLYNAIDDLGYTLPTPVQEKCIPLILAGHDVIGVAQTGTGKTAAYLLPILMKIKFAQGHNPRALIIAPTRELAMQIDKNITELAAYTDIRHTVIFGGTGTKTQIEALSKGIDILVTTPGRLMDMYKERHVILKNLQIMVLDEADRMMDMGFLPQIRNILEIIPSKKRQNLLFSATMPEKVLHLTEDFLAFPVKVEVTPPATAAETVEQVIYYAANIKTKINLLEFLLKNNEEEMKRVIIFTRTRTAANNLYKFIHRKVDTNAKVIHANKDQNTRTNAVEQFSKGDVRILVATDVVARGLDITMVSHVINFDVPILYEDYVHRIGRTGRAYQEGKAITFCNPAEEYHVRKIQKLIRTTIPILDIPEGVEVTETPFIENQKLLREVDFQKQKDDPNYLGAFHEKKRKPKKEDKSKIPLKFRVSKRIKRN